MVDPVHNKSAYHPLKCGTHHRLIGLNPTKRKTQRTNLHIYAPRHLGLSLSSRIEILARFHDRRLGHLCHCGGLVKLSLLSCHFGRLGIEKFQQRRHANRICRLLQQLVPIIADFGCIF